MSLAEALLVEPAPPVLASSRDVPDETPEVPLTGGTNRGLVVRSGQTVRRPQRPNSDAIHALLGHLEEAGFDGAPRFLGTESVAVRSSATSRVKP